MRSLSHQIVTGVPAVLALALLMLCAAAMQVGGVSLTPNVAWLMTLVLMPLAPARWPRGFAFGLGLLQDVLFHTPLGAQALLSLLLGKRTHLGPTPTSRSSASTGRFSCRSAPAPNRTMWTPAW